MKRKKFPLIPLPLIFIEEVKEDLSFLSDFSLLALIKPNCPVMTSNFLCRRDFNTASLCLSSLT